MFAQTNWDTNLLTSPRSIFYQGSTLALEFVLLLSPGHPVTTADYELTFILKKAEHATNVLYRTSDFVHDHERPLGQYKVVVPLVVSNALAPGVYYFAINVVDKVSQRVLPPFRGSFVLELSAASPNPALKLQDGEPTADGLYGTADEKLSPAEITGPNTPDILHPA